MNKISFFSCSYSRFSGMKKLREQPSVSTVIEQGWLEMEDADLLATVDATLAAMATWLEGALIGQTVGYILFP